MTQYNDKSQTLIDESSTESSVYKEKVDQAQQKASEVAEEAKHQASVLTEQAKAEAKSSLQSQKEMAAQELHGVAQALRQTGDNLREQDQTMFARYSNQVADRVERASTYLEEHDLDELMVEAEDFARRQPELFIGGAFTLGLLAARFLKSSASSLDDTRRSNLPERSRPTAVTSYTPSVDYPYAPSTVDDRYRNRPRA